MGQIPIEQVLKDRSLQYGSFHTLANLSQTLMAVIQLHYASTHKVEGQGTQTLPHFMSEALHMICHKVSRIANGNPNYIDSWQDISGYAQRVVEILVEYEEAARKNGALSQEELIDNPDMISETSKGE
jgi:hypothetical protein